MPKSWCISNDCPRFTVSGRICFLERPAVNSVDGIWRGVSFSSSQAQRHEQPTQLSGRSRARLRCEIETCAKQDILYSWNRARLGRRRDNTNGTSGGKPRAASGLGRGQRMGIRKLAYLPRRHRYKVTVVQLHACSRSDFKVIGLIETHKSWE